MVLSRLAVTALFAFSSGADAAFGLAGQLFQLSGEGSVNNAKLAWELVSGASAYQVEVAVGGAAFKAVGTTPGNTYDVYGLARGANVFRITARNGQSTVDQSHTASLSPLGSGGSYSQYDNTRLSSLRRKANLEANGVYYRYNYEAANGGFSRLVVQTSSNGYDFSGDKTVLTADVLCASVNGKCKLERIQFQKNPTTEEFVMWAHFERAADYGLGQVAVAHGTPGGQLQFAGTFRPLGDGSRDMTFFTDGPKAYLVTSTRGNQDNAIYTLDAKWTTVVQRVATVNVGGAREAPAVVKVQGYYYIFTSSASGWLPSQGQYISAKSMSGPWSAPVNVGNTATFASQSGGVFQLTGNEAVMLADQWRSLWPTNGGQTREVMLPISFGGGFAAYFFYKTVFYAQNVGAYGVQSGRILSVGKPSSSDAGSEGIAQANDGVQNKPGRNFKPKTVPFTYKIDLQGPHTITQVDLSTNIVPGSETFYRFTVEGTTDGTTWTVIGDQSANVDPGFVATYISSSGKFTSVRINVKAIINSVNGHEADFASGISEVTVYGF